MGAIVIHTVDIELAIWPPLPESIDVRISSVLTLTAHVTLRAVQLRINEGALVITRTGLSKMSTVLQLEAVYGYGRESLIGLHTLVLSYNQLQVR